MSQSAIAGKIAIVDDHEDVRVALSSLLRSCGYQTASFDSAESLLALPVLDGCRCIISDLQMPGMSGLALLEHLRRRGCAIPFVVLTAFPEATVRERALRGGAACFLSKPVDGGELLRCLQLACGQP